MGIMLEKTKDYIYLKSQKAFRVKTHVRTHTKTSKFIKSWASHSLPQLSLFHNQLYYLIVTVNQRGLFTARFKERLQFNM